MDENGAAPSRLHYGWVIVVTGTLCVLASLGLGRFALGMILPSMTASLHLTYAQAGWIGTLNFTGYLVAVLVCGPLAAAIGARRLIFLALLLVGGSMLLMSRGAGFGPLVVLYALTGFGSGASNVPIMGLVARWFQGSVRGRAAGFVTIGSGFAIIGSGQLIPWVNRARGAEGWRTSWVVLGLAVVVIAFVALALLRNRPEERGLRPFGDAPPGPPAAHAPSSVGDLLRNRKVHVLGLVYALFGFTYAIYVTFIVTALVRDRGITEGAAGRFWAWVGFLSLLSGPVFGTLSDRLGRRAALALVFSVQAVAYGLAGAAWLPSGFLYLSIGCFGVAAWSIPTIMLAAVTDHVGPERALGAYGVLTFFFGIGQIAGPAVAGVLAQGTGSFSSSFLAASVLAAFAAAVSVVGLRSPAPQPAAEPRLAT